MIFWGNIVMNSNLQKGRILKSRRFNDKKRSNFNLVNDAKFGGVGVLCSHTYYPSCREAMTIFVVVGNPQPNYAFSFDKHIGCDKIDNT